MRVQEERRGRFQEGKTPEHGEGVFEQPAPWSKLRSRHAGPTSVHSRMFTGHGGVGRALPGATCFLLWGLTVARLCSRKAFRRKHTYDARL